VFYYGVEPIVYKGEKITKGIDTVNPRASLLEIKGIPKHEASTA